MGTYREWIGKNVRFEGSSYKVVDVDYNGMLLIDKKARYIDTTAIQQYDAEKLKSFDKFVKMKRSGRPSAPILEI